MAAERPESEGCAAQALVKPADPWPAAFASPAFAAVAAASVFCSEVSADPPSPRLAWFALACDSAVPSCAAAPLAAPAALDSFEMLPLDGLPAADIVAVAMFAAAVCAAAMDAASCASVVWTALCAADDG